MNKKENILTKPILITEDNVFEMKSVSLYGNSYKIGDKVFIIFVCSGMEQEEFIFTMTTITESELPMFLEHHVQYENKFVPKWMLPEETKEIII